MKSRDTLLRLKRFQADEKRRRVTQLELMIAEFNRMAGDLDREIATEEQRARISDPTHFAYPTYARAARSRRTRAGVQRGLNSSRPGFPPPLVRLEPGAWCRGGGGWTQSVSRCITSRRIRRSSRIEGDGCASHNRPTPNRHEEATMERQRGQGMTEYIIIVALISVAAIGIYTLFGQTLRNQTAGLALELSGQDAATSIGSAQTNANAAQTNAKTRKGLDNYNAQNRP